MSTMIRPWKHCLVGRGGLDANFVPFTPHESALHYISPDAYAEMLDIVADIELESLKNKLVQSDCFSIQLDKSVDKYNIDSLFGTIRFLDVDTQWVLALLASATMNSVV